MENNWLNLMNLLKRILRLTDIGYHLKNKKMSNELVVEKGASELKNIEKNNPDN